MLTQLRELDRLAPRQRPAGRPLMHQNWGKLLFMHWRIEPERLRALIPAGLEIETFDNSAWIAIVPFTMWNTRPSFLPPVRGLSAMHELNVRTYVHYNGVPGVWFFSLDCTSSVAVMAARKFYHLPYYNADIDLQQADHSIQYSLTRTDGPPANFQASWRIGNRHNEFATDSLEFFLTERYCLYSEHNGNLYRAHIHHEPWPLAQAELDSFSPTMFEPIGIQTPAHQPLLHYAEEIKVEIWRLRKL